MFGNKGKNSIQDTTSKEIIMVVIRNAKANIVYTISSFKVIVCNENVEKMWIEYN